MAGVGAGEDDVTLAKASSRSPKSLVPLQTRLRETSPLREHKGHVALGVDHDVVIERLGKVEQGLEHS